MIEYLDMLANVGRLKESLVKILNEKTSSLTVCAILADASEAEAIREPSGSRLHQGYIDAEPPGSHKYYKGFGHPSTTKANLIWPPSDVLQLPPGRHPTNQSLSVLRLRGVTTGRYCSYVFDMDTAWLEVGSSGQT